MPTQPKTIAPAWDERVDLKRWAVSNPLLAQLPIFHQPKWISRLTTFRSHSPVLTERRRDFLALHLTPDAGMVKKHARPGWSPRVPISSRRGSQPMCSLC
jgi:hypothetical protein